MKVTFYSVLNMLEKSLIVFAFYTNNGTFYSVFNTLYQSLIKNIEKTHKLDWSLRT